MKNILQTRAAWDIYLSSSSPRRQELLSNLGIEFTVVKAVNQEPAPKPGEKPEKYAMRAADAKNIFKPSAADRNFAVLSADTVVYAENRIFGKPKNSEDALIMLQTLNGRAHWVVSAAALRINGNPVIRFYERSRVIFDNWPQSVLAAYIKSGEPLDKAGAYAIQGKGSFLVKVIEGSVTNIIGLPLNTLIKELLVNDIIEVS